MNFGKSTERYLNTPEVGNVTSSIDQIKLETLIPDSIGRSHQKARSVVDFRKQKRRDSY